MIPHRRTSQLSTECANHVRRIDSISRLGQNAVNGAPVRNHCRLDAEIKEEGLDDRPCDCESADVGADARTRKGDDKAEDDREERNETIGDKPGPDRAKEHGCDAYEGEKTDDYG